MTLAAIREKYQQCRAYHCVWSVSVRDIGEVETRNAFEYSVTFFDGSCFVSLSQRMVSFYSARGRTFNNFYAEALEEHVTTCDPEVFVGGLIGVSYRFAHCMPGWLFHCKPVGREQDWEVFPNLSAAERALSGAAGNKFAVIPTEDCLIAEAFYRTPEYVASFKPGVQAVLL